METTRTQKTSLLVSCLMVLAGVVAGQDITLPPRIPHAATPRAAAMGGGSVALADDFSALLSNPAGMAFVPVREFTVSLTGFRREVETRFAGVTATKERDDRQRLRLSAVGFVRSIPALSGGLTFGGGYQCPVYFDEVLSYRGRVGSGADWREITSALTRHGQFAFWPLGFGIQIAPGLAAGASIALARGRHDVELVEIVHSADDVIREEYTVEHTLTGYDARIGLMQKFGDRVTVGLRYTAPARYNLDELLKEKIDTVALYRSDGVVSLAGELSGGVAVATPAALLTLDLDAQSPHPDAPGGSPTSDWSIGVRAGVETPTPFERLVFRAGGGWREFSYSPYLIEYENEETFAAGQPPEVHQNPLRVTTGLSWLSESDVQVACSYTVAFWETETRNTLVERHWFHALQAGFSLRY